jgi:hypothetical protein
MAVGNAPRIRHSRTGKLNDHGTNWNFREYTTGFPALVKNDISQQ